MIFRFENSGFFPGCPGPGTRPGSGAYPGFHYFVDIVLAAQAIRHLPHQRMAKCLACYLALLLCHFFAVYFVAQSVNRFYRNFIENFGLFVDESHDVGESE